MATPLNLIVLGPAGYRFGDDRKLRQPLRLVTFIAAVLFVPPVWPF